ncbi:MAG: hypothetical protein L0J17_08115 [Brevibacterium sp.]|uniref:hypothetical protein n=1 Tax=Brevibacterium sp. TaxID=1701 RepID=UPI002649BB45|nr:hypothetical protein [Brevibacterium sp.]MDN5807603.1 hypothetical protein [Brevibacterium sp.]MDN5833159.1 hypothetical protein [Brevibacterium sp.]MDN5876462.1 hypothetical protein [Brevibacterium sp.]MDN6135331.1 hypothetical protein [Brevibacterium sp.]MDN6157748.1 hypothetical protein [Brevibacterium sp.]
MVVSKDDFDQALIQELRTRASLTSIENLRSIMPRVTIGLSIVLIAVGAIAYVATAFASWTALIPAILGAVILVCGLIGLKNQKLGIHIALVVAILGIVGAGMNVMQIGALIAGDAERPAAVVTSIITFVLLIVYVIMGVRSFIAARRWKNSAQAETAQQ